MAAEEQGAGGADGGLGAGEPAGAGVGGGRRGVQRGGGRRLARRRSARGAQDLPREPVAAVGPRGPDPGRAGRLRREEREEAAMVRWQHGISPARRRGHVRRWEICPAARRGEI